MNAISNLYRRARAEGWAPKVHDPVGDMIEKPTASPDEPLWLEVSETALYLAAARKCPAGLVAVGHPPVPFGYELIATYLLTGGRQDEVARPRDLRRRSGAQDYRLPAKRMAPTDRTGEERMLTDIRKLLDRVTERVGAVYVMDRGARRKAKSGEIRTKVFRHTYITARLQTLDRGAPISVWTVAREVGHSGRR